jgi:PadR family transcriptional regulator PadR
MPTILVYMVAGTARDRGSQLLKGVLDMCLLSIIGEEPSYGYEMVRKLQARGLELVSEGSIYPLLSRLEKGRFIDGYLVQSREGPARKYYRITARGEDALRAWKSEWSAFRDGVDDVLAGER